MYTKCLLFYVIAFLGFNTLFSQTFTFNYTGAMQTWVVPAGITSVNLTVAGAKGGGSNGGNGAIISKNCYAVTPGQTLYIYVGGMGTQGNNSGGWNGGGTGYASTTLATYSSYGGGGGTDIRIGGTALSNRVIVAGGGGGRSGGSGPVCGGAANCNIGAAGCSTFGAGGGGATTTAGGAGGTPWAGTPPGGAAGTLGIGGQAGLWQTASGGGGGGGLYGGGGGGNDGCCEGANGGGGGGGGSSLVPAGGTCTAAGNAGHGYVTITASTLPGVSATNTGPYCAGQTIQLNSTGGGTYVWSGPNGFSSTLQNPTIPNSTVANTGVYTVVVTNSGCSASATTTVALGSSPTATLTPTNAACANGNGSINVLANGGTPGFNVSWTGPVSGNPAGNEITTAGGSYSISGATVGTYTVTITDVNGCTSNSTTTISQPLPLQVSATQTPPLCNGVNNGSIAVIATDGTASYDVSWTGPTTGSPVGFEITSNGGTYTITNAGAGTYTITLTDANGCTTTTTSTLTPPTALSVANQVTPILCNGASTGAIQITASNGTPGYDVSWAGPINGNPAGVEIASSGGSYTIGNLTAGTYTVYVADVNSCSDSVSVQVIEPALLTQQNTPTPTLCATSLDGQINVVVSGGVSPYNLELNGSLLSNPPGDEILVSGGNYSFTNLGIGNYNVIITDDNNCTLTVAITVPTNNNPPTMTIVNDTICNGQQGSLIPVVNPTGGTYLWNNNSSNATLTASPNTSTQYSVTYTYNGCVAQATGSIIVNPIPTLSLTGTTICAGSSATLTPTGMQPVGGTYLWSTNSTNNSITVSPGSTTNYQVTYSVNGCSSTPATANVVVNAIPIITINNPTICAGGTSTLTASPNIPGGTIVWSPTNETALSINVSPPTTSTYSAVYTVNGCSSQQVNSTVTVNAIPIVSFASDLLQGCSPLSVNLWNTSADAASSTQTQWTIDNTSSFLGDVINPTLMDGCHDFTLTMIVNGCTGSTTLNNYICVESIPNASFTASSNAFTENSEQVDFFNGSVGASTYLWIMGDGNTYTSNDVSHLYTETGNGQTIWLYAYSTLGCVDSTSITIPFEESILFYIPNTFTPDGDEANNVFRPIITSGIDLHSFEMSIFNRWGELIFFSQDPEIGWDGSYGTEGKDVQIGTYTYKISFKTLQVDDRRYVTGHVNVIR